MKTIGLILTGAVIGVIATITSISDQPDYKPAMIPYCQEDEVILFNLPERNTFWCYPIDNLDALFGTPEFGVQP